MQLKVQLPMTAALSTLTFLPLRTDHLTNHGRDTVLYVRARDQARVAPDFLAVIDFDGDSARARGARAACDSVTRGASV
jgi:hypothetical protein